jgi:two-component system phosphate regulon sensor histidine kinase PhoR
MSVPWKSSWYAELGIAVVILVLATVAGLREGWQSLLLVATISSYLGWHLFQIRRLNLWIQDPGRGVKPFAFGIWSSIPEKIAKIQQRDKKRKKKLSKMLNDFQKSTSALPDATVVLDDGHNIEWWNSKAVEILGFDSKEYQGRRIDELLSDPIFRAFLAAGDFNQPLQMPAPVDDSIMLEVRIVPYGKGNLLLQARDITRLAQLETIRRDFVANVSHEMRTPLTVIHGYLETLVDSDDHGLQPWRQIVNQMQQQSSRMQRIVEDLLLLSRLESKQQTEHREMIDVAALLTAIKEEAEGLSGNQNHVIALRIEPGLRIEGSASELDSAFSNLVFNAVRYTPAGGEIKLRWWQDEDGPCFSVTDTGIGIQAEHIPRLTERFYRVDVGRSRKSGGTGLGLAIVKHVLIRHNARLEIESEPGKGSTFSCRFPVALAPEAVAKAS